MCVWTAREEIMSSREDRWSGSTWCFVLRFFWRSADWRDVLGPRQAALPPCFTSLIFPKYLLDVQSQQPWRQPQVASTMLSTQSNTLHIVHRKPPVNLDHSFLTGILISLSGRWVASRRCTPHNPSIATASYRYLIHHPTLPPYHRTFHGLMTLLILPQI